MNKSQLTQRYKNPVCWQIKQKQNIVITNILSLLRKNEAEQIFLFLLVCHLKWLNFKLQLMLSLNTFFNEHGRNTIKHILSCPYAIHTCDFSLPFMNYAIIPNSWKWKCINCPLSCIVSFYVLVHTFPQFIIHGCIYASVNVHI